MYIDDHISVGTIVHMHYDNVLPCGMWGRYVSIYSKLLPRFPFVVEILVYTTSDAFVYVIYVNKNRAGRGGGGGGGGGSRVPGSHSSEPI